MRAAVYHRVSRLDQNPKLARVELRRAAAARQLRIVLDVEEKASGARNDREGLRQVLDAARRHRVDAVLVWKLDRFGRSLIDLVANVRQLRDAGVRFVCVSQGIDLGRERDSAAELQFNVLCAVAEYERDVIRERTLLGLAAARRRGARIGRPSEGPDPAAVLKLKRRFSWPEVAHRLGKSVMQCRRAAAKSPSSGRS
jgi:putative DNA-invertase from lambdoid prophage Rac